MRNRIIGHLPGARPTNGATPNRQARRAAASSARRSSGLVVPDGMGGFVDPKAGQPQHRPLHQVCQEILGKIAGMFGNDGVAPLLDEMKAAIKLDKAHPLTPYEQAVTNGVVVMAKVQKLAREHFVKLAKVVAQLEAQAQAEVDAAQAELDEREGGESAGGEASTDG